MDEAQHEGGLNLKMAPVPYARTFSVSSFYNQKTFPRKRRASISFSQTPGIMNLPNLPALLTSQGGGRCDRRLCAKC
jgi:hypothetical protein